MKHVVMFSGGAGSWAAAKRVAELHGTDDLVLLFADTKYEDEDLYRFIDEAAANVGGELVKIADGRDIWDVFHDERFLGNSRIDPCSKNLKRIPMRRWLEDNCDPAETVAYLGIDFFEIHRFANAQRYWQPWNVEAPLCEPPYLDKEQMLEWLRREGIAPPRLYAQGFPHNNCGGGCVKAGMSVFKLLLERNPHRYAEWERKEQEMRDFLHKDVAILTDRRGGGRRPLTLREFRVRLTGGDACETVEDGSGCACVTPGEESDA